MTDQTNTDPTGALREYIRCMPGGEYIGSRWETPPTHKVTVFGHEDADSFSYNLITAAYPPAPRDDGEDGLVFTVPKLIADMLAWYSGEEAGFWAEDTELIDEDRGGVRDYSELAIWLDPQSIRNHFECCDPNPVDGVSDELLAEVAADFLDFTGTWHRISDIFNEIETMVEERKTA